MANVVIFDEDTKRVKRYLKSVHTPNYINRSDALVNPAVNGINLRYCKVIDGEIVNMTEEEIAAADREHNLANYSHLRSVEYRAIDGEQLDAIMKQLALLGDDQIEELKQLQSKRQEIKEKYPKGD